MLDLLKGMVDFSMFLEFHFLLMSIATVLLFTWFIVPYFYLAELMVTNKYTQQDASTVISVIGLANFTGMVRLYHQAVTPSLTLSRRSADRFI
jgi:predicted MFS family arabinose efflux permease